MINNIYFYRTMPLHQSSLAEVFEEICLKSEPKPLFCEIPEDLKTRTNSSYGTAQTYTYTSSMVSFSSISTTTTTY